MHIEISRTDIVLNALKNERFQIWLYTYPDLDCYDEALKMGANRWDFVGQLICKRPKEQMTASKL